MGNFHQKIEKYSEMEYLEFTLGLLSAHFTSERSLHDHKRAQGIKVNAKLPVLAGAGLGFALSG